MLWHISDCYNFPSWEHDIGTWQVTTRWQVTNHHHCWFWEVAAEMEGDENRKGGMGEQGKRRLESQTGLQRDGYWLRSTGHIALLVVSPGSVPTRKQWLTGHLLQPESGSRAWVCQAGNLGKWHDHALLHLVWNMLARSGFAQSYLCPLLTPIFSVQSSLKVGMTTLPRHPAGSLRDSPVGHQNTPELFGPKT